MNAKEAKAQNAENSKNLVTIPVNEKMTVRIYSKSRAKGDVKFKKKRDSLTFKTADAANTHINKMVEAGAKIRKVEVIAEDGTVSNMKPTRVRITPTKEEKAKIKAERQAARDAKAADKAKAKAEAKAQREAAKAEKAKAKAKEAAKVAKAKETAKTKATPKAKNTAAEALA
jgi:hypothetical protein